MKLFTIGFTQKRAEQFFELLRKHSIQMLVDIRLKPNGQLSGFAKQDDLPYFLHHLANGCRYVYSPLLAPSKEILDDYRDDLDWQRYSDRFEMLMEERGIPEVLDRLQFNTLVSCILCSEATPEKCHRRLVAERLAFHWPDVEVIHL